jgi:hypothetical protein
MFEAIGWDLGFGGGWEWVGRELSSQVEVRRWAGQKIPTFTQVCVPVLHTWSVWLTFYTSVSSTIHGRGCTQCWESQLRHADSGSSGPSYWVFLRGPHREGGAESRGGISWSPHSSGRGPSGDFSNLRGRQRLSAASVLLRNSGPFPSSLCQGLKAWLVCHRSQHHRLQLNYSTLLDLIYFLPYTWS